MSLGVNEHFSGQPRQTIFDAHFAVLKSGGRTLIAVPNRYCLSYRAAMLMWKLTGRWPQGLYEYGFTRKELVRRMCDAGFEEISVVSGTRPVDDFHRYILGNLRAAMRKFLHYPSMVKESLIPVTNEMVRAAANMAEPPVQLVSSQSYMWIAMGRRKRSF
ncbi:MAG: hypothetical protein BMS9Abin18_0926 [Zetaproteobacteria bacterium]|nr:MAG: hypothetical protein BMS9Abin18_0926 [Zetaproteobacteria bacterium]